VYQLTAVDVFTRFAMVRVLLGPVTSNDTMRFVEHLVRHYRRHGVRVRAVLSDIHPEWRDPDAFDRRLTA
jgi:hypothetical protein